MEGMEGEGKIFSFSENVLNSTTAMKTSKKCLGYYPRTPVLEERKGRESCLLLYLCLATPLCMTSRAHENLECSELQLFVFQHRFMKYWYTDTTSIASVSSSDRSPQPTNFY